VDLMELREKPLPKARFKNIFPPNKDRTYFEHGKLVPFRFGSNKFQMVNAWWLAEAALLAYADETFIKGQCSNAGLTEVEFFNGQSTQCVVASNENFVIAAFRGTEVFKPQENENIREIIADFLTDSRFLLVDSGQGGCVHEGFKKGLKQVWESNGGTEGVRHYLDTIKNEGGRQRTVWFTGHSLGAALATLAADQYGAVQGLYTFGSPLVGDGDFGNDFHVHTYRFVNNNDIVTKVPPAGIYLPPRIPRTGQYRHVGALKFIDRDGHIHDNPHLNDNLMGGFSGDVVHRFNPLDMFKGGRFKSGFLEALSADVFVDHTPLFYATHIWNNFVRDLHRQG
jgi:triacylglycerol lipase